MKYLYEQDLNEFTDLQHIEWLAEHLDEFTYTGSGTKIRDTLLNAIQKKNTFYDVCENSYKEFVDAFNNNPYDYQIGILEKHDIETSHPMNYIVPWSHEGTTYMVPVGYLMEKARDADFKKARTIILEHWANGRSKCADLMTSIINARQPGQDYARRLQNMFGRTDGKSEMLKRYKGELKTDTILCFMLCLVYLYCFRESGIIGLIRSGSLERTVSMVNGNIGLIIKIIGMVVIGTSLINFTRKVFWKTFIAKRLTQMYQYCCKSHGFDDTIDEVLSILAKEINENALLEKYCFAGDLCDALQLSHKRFSTEILKDIKIEQYLKMYVGIRKGMLWYIPICILITVFL